jgi:hypothetical protein
MKNGARGPVAHAYNPSYPGGRDQEDHSSKPVQANSSWRPYLEKPFTKIGLMEWLQGKALSSSSSTTKKEEKKKRWLLEIHLTKLNTYWKLLSNHPHTKFR